MIASQYTFALWNGHPHTWALIVGAVVWIGLMTWICYRGIELSARVQTVLLGIEIFTLALFAVVALIKVYANHPAHSIRPDIDWLNPFSLSTSALTGGLLLGVFIYWGWDSGVAVNEESESSDKGPGLAGILSTVILLVIYVLATAKIPAWALTALGGAIALGITLFAFAFAAARRQHLSVPVEGLSAVRRLVTMAPQGLGVGR